MLAVTVSGISLALCSRPISESWTLKVDARQAADAAVMSTSSANQSYTSTDKAPSSPARASSYKMPGLGKTRCYWAIMDSSMNFRYLDPVLQAHMHEVSWRRAHCGTETSCSSSHPSSFRRSTSTRAKGQQARSLEGDTRLIGVVSLHYALRLCPPSCALCVYVSRFSARFNIPAFPRHPFSKHSLYS